MKVKVPIMHPSSTNKTEEVTMTPPAVKPYRPKHHVRILTAASLFDGHDAAINIMRRIMQQTGAEVVHLGHNRSVAELVKAAVEEDVQGVAVTSYQGGHMEFFTYLRQRLNELGLAQVRVVGGGGGTILPSEIEELSRHDIRIYSPDDGRFMGLQGMINDPVLVKFVFEDRNYSLEQLVAVVKRIKMWGRK